MTKRDTAKDGVYVCMVWLKILLRMQKSESVIPEVEKNEVAAAADITHPLGRLKTGGDRTMKPCQIIMRFVLRAVRDLTWKHAS